MGSVKRFDVRYTTVAASQLAELKARAAAKPQSAEATFYDAVKRLATSVLVEPSMVLDKRWALGNHASHDFRGIYRHKVGRMRLFYIASSAKRLVVVLLLGQRKAGDRRDAYEELARRLASGELDTVFAEVGTKRPSG